MTPPDPYVKLIDLWLQDQTLPNIQAAIDDWKSSSQFGSRLVEWLIWASWATFYELGVYVEHTVWCNQTGTVFAEKTMHLRMKNILEQIYKSKYVLIIFMMIIIFFIKFTKMQTTSKPVAQKPNFMSSLLICAVFL